MSHHQILGIYADPTQAAQAIAAVQKENLGQVVAYSPVQHHAIERVLPGEGSRVGLFTLVGGLLGGFSGFALPIYTSLEWALITGDKPVIAIPAFTVIAFELTILFGGVLTVLGLVAHGFLGASRQNPAYRPAFSQDEFGFLVECHSDQIGRVQELLGEAGCKEVRVVEG